MNRITFCLTGKKLLFVLIIFCISAIDASWAQSKRTSPKPAKPPSKTEIKPPAKAATKPVVKAEVNYKVSWGPDLKLKGDAPNNILLYENGSFYAITDSRGGLFSKSSDYLSKFNSKMELVLQNKVETEKSDKSVSHHELMRIMEFNNEIYAITSEQDKRAKKLLFFAEKINLTTLVPDGNKKKIFEVDYSVDKKREDDAVSILNDVDKKHILIYDQPKIEKEQNIKLYVIALDKSLSSLWSKDVELPLKADKRRYIYFDKYIDPSSNLYLLTKVYADTEKKKNKTKDVVEGELNYDYHIYMIGKDIPTYVDYPFNLKDKAVSQVKLEVNEKGQLVACGFYGDINRDKNKVSGGKGVFYTIIDPEKNAIKAQSYKKFEAEVFTAGLSAKKASKQEKKMEEGKADETDTYVIDKLIQRKDGGVTMIAENFYTYTVTHTVGNRTYTTTYFVYGNIIVTKINSSGEIEWTTVIPKKQVVTGMTEICSYIMFDERSDTYDFYFNDHRDNLSATSLSVNGAEVMNGKLKNMRFVREVVNPDGSLSKREVAFKIDEDDEDTRFCPTVSKIVNDDEIILYGVDHKKDKFAKIVYSNLEPKN